MPRSSAKPPVATTESPVAHFEQSLGELEQLVAKMEAGEMGLDESLASFERGIALYRSCQAALEQSEARVRVLLDPDRPETARPIESGKPPGAGDEDLPF